jgi:hypothetical protein
MAKNDSTPTKNGGVILVGNSVRVWSEVGVTIAVTDDPPQFLRFSFGHERIAKSSSQEEIRKTAALVDEFNEAELDRRLAKYRRVVKRAGSEEHDGKPKKGSVQDRARKKLRK